ncbi:hypothetical protein LY76DRAFT_121079 [Colletotrichum caudatum]|nr:hypothetical protein LY76DRAFT_121079 [Colletotrichum caudatum]
MTVSGCCRTRRPFCNIPLPAWRGTSCMMGDRQPPFPCRRKHRMPAANTIPVWRGQPVRTGKVGWRPPSPPSVPNAPDYSTLRRSPILIPCFTESGKANLSVLRTTDSYRLLTFLLSPMTPDGELLLQFVGLLGDRRRVLSSRRVGSRCRLGISSMFPGRNQLLPHPPGARRSENVSVPLSRRTPVRSATKLFVFSSFFHVGAMSPVSRTQPLCLVLEDIVSVEILILLVCTVGQDSVPTS